MGGGGRGGGRGKRCESLHVFPACKPWGDGLEQEVVQVPLGSDEVCTYAAPGMRRRPLDPIVR